MANTPGRCRRARIRVVSLPPTRYQTGTAERTSAQPAPLCRVPTCPPRAQVALPGRPLRRTWTCERATRGLRLPASKTPGPSRSSRVHPRLREAEHAEAVQLSRRRERRRGRQRRYEGPMYVRYCARDEVRVAECDRPRADGDPRNPSCKNATSTRSPLAKDRARPRGPTPSSRWHRKRLLPRRVLLKVRPSPTHTHTHTRRGHAQVSRRRRRGRLLLEAGTHLARDPDRRRARRRQGAEGCERAQGASSRSREGWRTGADGGFGRTAAALSVREAKQEP